MFLELKINDQNAFDMLKDNPFTFQKPCSEGNELSEIVSACTVNTNRVSIEDLIVILDYHSDFHTLIYGYHYLMYLVLFVVSM